MTTCEEFLFATDIMDIDDTYSKSSTPKYSTISVNTDCILITQDYSKLDTQTYNKLDTQTYSKLDTQDYSKLDTQDYSKLDTQTYSTIECIESKDIDSTIEDSRVYSDCTHNSKSSTSENSTIIYNSNKKYIFDKGTYLYAKNYSITTPNELADLFKKIKNPREIKYIDLSDNNIDDHIDITKIIEQLFTIKFPNLEYINLSGNKLGHKFIMGLIKILQKYKKDMSLDISNNKITPYDQGRILKAWPNGCIVL